MGEVKMTKQFSNKQYIACFIAVGVFVVTADAQHLPAAIDYGLNAVLLAKAT
ncbi:hypothetical protein GJV14_23950 [Enterobacteriaceae bacterium RIT697]|nr:hypothetical protein [Enterobacteriaceae bacterium RIT697]